MGEDNEIELQCNNNYSIYRCVCGCVCLLYVSSISTTTTEEATESCHVFFCTFYVFMAHRAIPIIAFHGVESIYIYIYIQTSTYTSMRCIRS